jgi:hypothetical protein
MFNSRLQLKFFISVLLLSVLSNIEGFIYGKYGFKNEIILLEILSGATVIYLFYLIYCYKIKENCYTKEE